MTWYQCTRHTFASRWIQAGGSLAKLAEILGHSTTEVTLRYAHLSPGNFTEQERQLVDVQLQDATVLPLARKRPGVIMAPVLLLHREVRSSYVTTRPNRNSIGGVAERLKAAVLKFRRRC